MTSESVKGESHSGRVSLTWPEEGLTRVPYEIYHDPEIYAREQERIFRGLSWNFVTLEAEIPKPGDFVRSFVGDTPVVVTRDPEGGINVFENRCSHRGVQFCLENAGNTKTFTCPYHQWSFDLCGRLRGVPFRKGIGGLGGMPPGFNPEANGLRRLKVTSRNGVVFASFAPELPTFEEYLGETNLAYFDRVFNGKQLRILGKHRQRVSANWKLVMENIKDSYHSTLLHVFFVTFGLWRADMDYSARFCPTGGTAIQFNSPSKKKGESAVASETKSMRADLKLQDPRIVDVVPEFPDGKSGAMHTIWPSLIVQQTVNSLAVRHAVPRGPGAFELHWTFFGYEDDSPEMVARRLRHVNLYGPSGLVSIDDSEVLQLVQKGSRASQETAAFVEVGGSGTTDSEGMINEVMIRAFYKYYREVMGL